MENGPRPTIDFDEMTNRQLYDVFVEAVKDRDSECVKECIKRDGLIFGIFGKSVAAHFAFTNDLESCEFLMQFDDNLTNHFFMGAVMGERFDFLQVYLNKYNLRKNVEDCAGIAFLINKTEQLKKYWYEDQLQDFMKYSVSCLASEDERTALTILYSQETTASLINQYPKLTIFITIVRDEYEMLWDFLRVHNTNDHYKSALHDAVGLRKFHLEEQLLTFIDDNNISSIVNPAIVTSDLSKVKFYFNKYKRFMTTLDIRNFALYAAKNGEVAIAKYLAEECWHDEEFNYKVLGITAENSSFKYAATCFFKSMPTTTLSEFIQNHSDSILDVQKQKEHQNEFRNYKIASEDLNTILEKMLILLEQQQLISLRHLKRQIFICDDEPAFHVLRKLTLTHNWLDRSCFLKEQAKLVTLSKATSVPLEKFYDFYNALCNELKQLKEQPVPIPAPTLALAQAPVQAPTQAAPQAPTPVPAQAPTQVLTTVPTQGPATVPTQPLPLASLRAAPSLTVSASTSSVRVFTPSLDHSKNRSKQNRGTSQSQKSITTRQSIKAQPTSSQTHAPNSQAKPKKQSSHLMQQNVPGPLPKTAEVVNLKGESNLKLKDLERKDDTVPNIRKTEKINQQSTHFDPLNELMMHLRETQQALNMDTNGLMIHDLAIIDLLLKINRDLNDERFSATFVHGMHHYLMQRSPSFSNAASFVNRCFAFGSKEVVNPLLRDSDAFILCIKNTSGIQTKPLERLELIRELFKLQSHCHELCRSNNVNLVRLGRHALSGIIMVIGEQVQQLNGTDIDKQLAELPVYKILNEYRHYRNVRHGTDYTKQVNDITFNLVRDDWDKQLDNIITNFSQYYCEKFVGMLEVSETQHRLQKMRL